jgi:H+/Cl- antiporter ClcA
VLFGAEGVRYTVAIPEISAIVMVQVVALSVLCAIVSVLFCLALKNCSVGMHKLFRNPYIRTVSGSLMIVALTCIFGTMDYNGAGMDVIARAMNGEAVAYAFILKILFTAVTIAAGFKGGEIVPTLFIGSTFGCVVGGLLGLDPAFGSSVGFVALFCGVVNCPFASVALALEVFGSDGILIYAVACAVSFMMSGNFSIYKSQKIVFSKITNEKLEENIK